MTGDSDYEDFPRVDKTHFFDTNFNGTSAAAPVVTGLVALYLEANPTASQKEVNDFIGDQGSIKVENSLYLDQYSNDSTTTYWTGSYNLRGASRSILRDRSASPTKPSIKGGVSSSNNLRFTGANLSFKHK